MADQGYPILVYEEEGHRTFTGRHAYIHDPYGNAIEIIDFHGIGDFSRPDFQGRQRRQTLKKGKATKKAVKKTTTKKTTKKTVKKAAVKKSVAKKPAARKKPAAKKPVLKTTARPKSAARRPARRPPRPQRRR